MVDEAEREGDPKLQPDERHQHEDRPQLGAAQHRADPPAERRRRRPASDDGVRGGPPAAYPCRTGSTRQIGRLASVSGAYSLKSHAMPYSRANQP